MVDDAVDEHPLADVERRLHRLGGDLVRLDEEGLDPEREPDRERDDDDELEDRAAARCRLRDQLVSSEPSASPAGSAAASASAETAATDEPAVEKAAESRPSPMLPRNPRASPRAPRKPADPEADNGARRGPRAGRDRRVALGLALGIQAFLVKPYQIPRESMEPTLDVGQRVLVNRFNYKLQRPGSGDIVVFHPPAGRRRATSAGSTQPPDQACPKPTAERGRQNFIKRIVAGPGDTLSIADGHPVVNGERSRPTTLHPPCAGSAAAISRSRSRFRPVTSS